MIAHIGFSDAPWILRRILLHFSNSQTTTFACCWLCSFFHGSWGPIPWVFGSRPWFFLPSHPSGTCFIKPSTRRMPDSFSCCLVLGFWSHATRLCFSSWSAGCVLRRRLLMSGSSFTPILGFGSGVSHALVCFFSPDCEFLVVIVRQRGSLPQLGQLPSRKLSRILCHCVVLDPRVPFVLMGYCVKLDPPVSLTSLAE